MRYLEEALVGEHTLNEGSGREYSLPSLHPLGSKLSFKEKEGETNKPKGKDIPEIGEA
jgi:hypothetical protein